MKTKQNKINNFLFNIKIIKQNNSIKKINA